MRLAIPLTGTVLVKGSVWAAGKLEGDPNDPIRPVDIGLGNVSWTMVDVDLENEVMIIEVSPADKIYDEPTQKTRPTTEEERQGFLQQAKGLVEGKTKDELYTISGSPRLKRKGLGKAPPEATG